MTVITINYVIVQHICLSPALISTLKCAVRAHLALGPPAPHSRTHYHTHTDVAQGCMAGSSLKEW